MRALPRPSILFASFAFIAFGCSAKVANPILAGDAGDDATSDVAPDTMRVDGEVDARTDEGAVDAPGCTIGAPCDVASSTCLTASPFTGGYCTETIAECPAPGGGPDPCGPGASCANGVVTVSGIGDYCLAHCTGDGDCRTGAGYRCCPGMTHDGATVCAPAAYCPSVHCATDGTWATMATAAIVPPRHAASLDVFGASGKGITRTEAEAVLCAGSDLGDLFADGKKVEGWGALLQVRLEYDPATDVGTRLWLGGGYVGASKFDRTRGGVTDHYAVVPGHAIQKNGADFTLDAGWSGASFEKEVTELYDGLVQTFAGASPTDPSCVAAKTCIVGLYGDIGFFAVPALGVSLWSSDVRSQPSASVVEHVELGAQPGG